MLTIEVNFLTGRYTAASHDNRGLHEWPPHPARLFSALVAAWADADCPDQTERAALEWLEKQAAPSIYASDAAPRNTVTHYVPINDVVPSGSYKRRANKIDELLIQMREARSEGNYRELLSLEIKLHKQRDDKTNPNPAVTIMPPGWVVTAGGYARLGYPRQYPSVAPADPRISYMWNAAPDSGTADAIDSLCARLTRLGHSSSLVSCRVVEDRPSPSYTPGESGSVLRCVRSGQLAKLESIHRQRQETPQQRYDLPSVSVQYRKTEPVEDKEHAVLRPATAGEWLVMGFLPRSRRFPSTMTVNISKTLKDALLHHAPDPIPEGLSGHRREGRPSTAPHTAFLPLPWVGHEHADGRLMGAAISIPDSLDSESRRAVLRAIGRWESTQEPLTLTLGRRGLLKMEREIGPSSLVTLRPGLWSRKSHRWVSALPIALPAHPGPLGTGTTAARSKAWARAEQSVADSCRHIGLPEPDDVTVSLAPLITGTQPATAFPAFRQGGKKGKPIARRLVHASVYFDRPVVGPVMLGAGRYLGLGLMRPLPERSTADA